MHRRAEFGVARTGATEGASSKEVAWMQRLAESKKKRTTRSRSWKR